MFKAFRGGCEPHMATKSGELSYSRTCPGGQRAPHRPYPWGVSYDDYLVLYHVQTDEPGHLFGLKMALHGILHHLFQLCEGIGFGKDVMSECPGGITTFRSFLYQKDYLLFYISLLGGAQFLNPDPAGR